MASRLLTFAALLPIFAWGKKPVTLADLAGGGFERPSAFTWAPDGQRYLTVKDGKLFVATLEPAAETEILKLADLEAKAKLDAAPQLFDWQNRRVTEERFQWSADSRLVLAYLQRDIFLIDVGAKTFKQLTATKDAERDPKLAADGKRVSFRRGSDLYAVDTASGKETRLTRDGSRTLLNGQLDWVYPEELDLGTAHWWSPDSQYIAYLQFDITPLGIYPHADLLKLDTPQEPEYYPKAGTPNSKVRLGVVPARGGKTVWIDLGDLSHALIARVRWTPDAKYVIAQKIARIQNEQTLLAGDPRSGKTHAILAESDPQWLNVHDIFHAVGRDQFLWASEKSGYRHLYLHSFDGKTEPKQLTSGDWEVSAVSCVDQKNRRVYFTSTEASPLERQLYWVSLEGGVRTRLTKAPGTHTVNMPPGCAFVVDSHSSLTEAPRRALYRADGEELRVLQGRNMRQAEEFEIPPTEIHEFDGPDGTHFYGRLIKPAGFDPAKKYPAIVMVYGGPHAQTVRNSWPGLTWDHALAHKGFVIWQMDNRGSAGRGHAWEAKVHKQFGKQELADQLVGVDYLVKQGFVDDKKIGMYGWSYGGYMTLYSLTNAPDRFAAGISGAPVTDWRLYDTIYTERYMDLPSKNELGYRDSSPVHKAANLKAKLLLVHNYGDDNVLFQNVFMMSNALQLAGKPFEMMVYPQKAHGVSGVARKHLLETTTSFFERSLK